MKKVSAFLENKHPLYQFTNDGEVILKNLIPKWDYREEKSYITVVLTKENIESEVWFNDLTSAGN